MPAGRPPGVLYMGGLIPQDRQLVLPILTGLVKDGYTRFIEPCSGSLGFSNVAVQAGFRPENIEASDVTLFSALIGAAADGKRVDALNIKVDGYEHEDLGDPATVLYLQSLADAESKAHSPYWRAIAKQMVIDRSDHLERLNSQLALIHDRYGGLQHRPMDLFDHLAEVKDDENAVVGLMPPWDKGGFEKFLDRGNQFQWAAPEYSVFDPKVGFGKLFEVMADSKCLIIMATTTDFWDGDPPAFALVGGYKRKEDTGVLRTGQMAWLSNRNDEVVKHSGGYQYLPEKRAEVKSAKWTFLPEDHPIGRESSVQLVPISKGVAAYYRSLWTHRFIGTSSLYNLAVLLDGYLVGVFGLNTGTRGSASGDVATLVQYVYGMAIQHRRDYRWPLLLCYLGMCREVLLMCFPTHTASIATKVVTVDMSGHKYSKGFRAKMMVNGVNLRPIRSWQGPDLYGGMATHHMYPVVDATIREIFEAWLAREEQWNNSREQNRKNREKNERKRRRRRQRRQNSG